MIFIEQKPRRNHKLVRYAIVDLGKNTLFLPPLLAAIMRGPRTFVRMRELMETNRAIAARVEKLERGHDRTASVIEVLVDDIDRLAREIKDMKALPPAKKRRIGFVIDDD